MCPTNAVFSLYCFTPFKQKSSHGFSKAVLCDPLYTMTWVVGSLQQAQITAISKPGHRCAVCRLPVFIVNKVLIRTWTFKVEKGLVRFLTILFYLNMNNDRRVSVYATQMVKDLLYKWALSDILLFFTQLGHITSKLISWF